MPKRWSKLQKEIYDLLDDSLNIQIHCSIYRMKSQYGGTDLPRYWITLDKDIIFDYPKQFLNERVSVRHCKNPESISQTVKMRYPYVTDVSDISEIIREYIDTPVSALPECGYEYDIWGLTDILKAADRRLGKKKLSEHFRDTDNDSVRKILTARGIM